MPQRCPAVQKSCDPKALARKQPQCIPVIFLPVVLNRQPDFHLIFRQRVSSIRQLYLQFGNRFEGPRKCAADKQGLKNRRY